MTRRLRIGVSGPFSGPRAVYGALLRDAATSANTGAQLIFADDMAQVKEAISVAMTFVEQDVDAVVGHFNSDCARAAGQIYRGAGIPFLMPAATAPDLIDVTAGYRICASDDAQVDVLAKWLLERGETLAEVWRDSSPYAARLAALIQSQGLVDPASPVAARPIAILGAHHAVADEINRRGRFSGPVFVPDDCAINDFDRLIADTEVTVACAVATPDYSLCVSHAFQILTRAIWAAKPLAEALAGDSVFFRKQSRLARFALVETTRANRQTRGGQP